MSMQNEPIEPDRNSEENTLQEIKADNPNLVVPVPLVKAEPIVSIDVIRDLAQKDSAGVIKFVENQSLRLSELYQKREENYSKQEENRHKETLAGESTRRIGMSLVFATIISVLVYAGTTGDKASFDKILTAALAAFGGAGVVTTFSKKSKPKDDP